ncbi:outer membrane beta-barrel protein [Ferruginibacter paludis]|uniref:outer membrane beta-barrel protein n=1 Tax=Ferruginibacter paludis TaxID=1310417 RepID=UPI0025B4EC35|nr:outer membrane beta-barrel protein [Ferruginibacter paludis]MDN3654794.1 outer membrane beta-barrel protein [Ferruginibacter paludis]
MIKKIFGTAIIALCAMQTLHAQDSTKSLTISGSVDGYYRYNFSNAAGNSNNKTSFTNSQSSFALGMATIKADATALSGKVTATADLGFGTRAEEFSYYESAAKSSLAMVKQLYLTYALSSNVKLTAGKFATHVGYEVMDAPLNRNYSMSYMFTNGPFSHTGVKMDVTAGPVGFMLGVANFIDQTTSTTSTKTLLAQVSGGSKDGKLKAYLNYAGFFGANEGSNPLALKSLSQLDLVVNATVTDKFGIGFNATMQDRKQIEGSANPSGSWKGLALYLNVDPSPTVGLTWRNELISDSKVVYYGTKSIYASTLSLDYKVGPFTLIPELRFEAAQSEIYSKNDGIGSKSTATALLAAVYKF